MESRRPQRLRSLLADWSKLGAELAARGPHRVAIALHAARAAATGGAQLTAYEEEQLAAWFASIIDEAVQRGGSSGDDRDETATAIWQVLSGDWHRDPARSLGSRESRSAMRSRRREPVDAAR